MAYFLLTLFYTTLVPFLFQIISALFIEPLCFLFILISGFILMMLYGNCITKSKRPKKPNSMTGVYVPVFLPLLWCLLWTGVYNVRGICYDRMAQLLHGLVSFNLFGQLTYYNLYSIPSNEWYTMLSNLDVWHFTLFLNLFYYGILLLGFAVGERRAARKLGIERKPFRTHRKWIAAIVLIAVCSYSASEFVLYRSRINIVPTAHPSYNFSYAGGYSSIDLNPYAVENEENILAKLNDPSSFTISNPQQMPILDGAEAAYPVYSAFANACYENIAEIQKQANKPGLDTDTVMPIQFSNTIYAYEKLLTGEIDIFFGAKPSEAQIQMARDAGVELVLTPIGREAFVFFVNTDNPVDGLSSEQIRDIYSGKINNWSKVGGKNKRILAFQRPENSGSQTMMEFFMGDTPLQEPLEAEYEASMGGLVRRVAEYEDSISSLGYSFRYYTTIMISDAGSTGDNLDIKLLAVDGVYPGEDTIRSGEYPYTTELYAITLAEPPVGVDSKDTIEPFLAWITGPQGQQLVADTGYVKYTYNFEGN